MQIFDSSAPDAVRLLGGVDKLVDVALRALIQSCLLEAGLSRGDLSEAEWRVLKGLLPIEAANRGRGRRPEQNRSIIPVGCAAAADTMLNQIKRWAEALRTARNATPYTVAA